MALGSAVLRLLLISSHEGCRTALEQSLESEIPDEYKLYWVSLPEVAEKRAKEILPQVIFIDDELIGASATSVVQRLRQQVPNAACVVIVNANNTSEAQRAVLEGARAFLVKPVDAHDLITAIKQIMENPAEKDEMHVASPSLATGRSIVVTAPKGGTGHTTLAINTAISMHKLTNSRVALVDADFYSPAIDIALNLHGEHTILDLLPRLSYLDQSIVMNVMTPHASGIHALLAPAPQIQPRSIPLPQVQEITMSLKRIFYWEFIDLRISLSDTAAAFLDSADGIIINILPELVGLRNTRLLLDMFLTRGYPKEKIIVVLNRWDMKGGIPPADIEKRLHIDISFRIPDDQPLATYSINRGVPVAVSHPKSALGRSYQDFARFLLQKCHIHTPELKKTNKPSKHFFLHLRRD